MCVDSGVGGVFWVEEVGFSSWIGCGCGTKKGARRDSEVFGLSSWNKGMPLRASFMTPLIEAVIPVVINSPASPFLSMVHLQSTRGVVFNPHIHPWRWVLLPSFHR